MLLQAVEDLESSLRRKGGAATRQWALTLAWFRSAAESPFSFVYVCQTLGLDPSYLRRGILSWAAQVNTDGTSTPPSLRQYIT